MIPLTAGLARELGDIQNLKKITPTELENLGYIFTANSVSVFLSRKKAIPDLIIKEIRDEDHKHRKELDFCYLFNPAIRSGVVVAKPFNCFRRVAEESIGAKKEAGQPV